jgi:pimeloyl-ACP methyl ester carboxylesterase
MNDVDELKQFAFVHARAQYIRGYRDVLTQIRTDDGDAPGSWVYEWQRAAEMLERKGQLLQACRYYNMARFPYPDGAPRRHALARCVHAFDRWRQQRQSGIERVAVDLPEGQVRCWADGLSTTARRPVLLIMGGIVSIKEQWAQGLVPMRRLGMASIATEMPGVGENTLRYGIDSWRMLSSVLDAVADRANVAETYALASSFSGHLALRCALHDPRIRGVASVGAPISDFFTDQSWQRKLPRITLDTLAHLTGMAFDDLVCQLPYWRLTDQDLAALEIPVCYLASRQDEIIPDGEVDNLRRNVAGLHLVEYNDVHASPRNMTESRLWTVLSILRMRHARSVQRAAVGALWHTLRLRRELTERADTRPQRTP